MSLERAHLRYTPAVDRGLALLADEAVAMIEFREKSSYKPVGHERELADIEAARRYIIFLREKRAATNQGDQP